MFRFNQILSKFLLTIILITSLPTRLEATENRGHNNSSLPKSTKIKDLAKSWQELLNNLFNNKDKDNPPPGTPGNGIARGNICPITPFSKHNTTEIWTNRPLFVWRGILGKIGVKLANSQDLLWSQTVDETDNRFPYTGPALTPGKNYEWVIFISQNGNNPAMKIPFKVIDNQERSQIRLDLIILGIQLQEKGTTSEEFTLEIAKYFAEKELWNDVLQQIYSIENPSEDLQNIIPEISTELCSG
ncbi:MAG TPA: hypothetical protein DEG17_13240 [Cyanobacteria bacterium UBA11149]|nr:hypothetical protein [Cyanobacteria bacterium UBA11367]HBE56583.1 hypothetical protein [Cyanobacteria bacterium UBA11366]HBK65295.1 hypothetical protein [Cyanobacteria bacterium UBA11166]HBR75177.1 hypothetical protein [Cyanobacteria bacterium UBA11159]HBS72150.1 hypothetical protein [Cyanobacteria bacterium UBA11153]HBW89805.1 hypothetical protein [Cyanobacteria bacterium UBA11149]